MIKDFKIFENDTQEYYHISIYVENCDTYDEFVNEVKTLKYYLDLSKINYIICGIDPSQSKFRTNLEMVAFLIKEDELNLISDDFLNVEIKIVKNTKIIEETTIPKDQLDVYLDKRRYNL